MLANNTNKLLEGFFKKEYSRLVAYITSIVGFQQFETAEDIAQETLASAIVKWGDLNHPQNPAGWLFTVAHNKALNYLKHEKVKKRVHAETKKDRPQVQEITAIETEDSLLQMMFACCHPNISMANQVTLILKVLCGFSRKEISRALLIDEEVVKKRLLHTKKLIIQKNIQLRFPSPAQLAKRLNTVTTCLYLLFNEGYNSTHSKEMIRRELCLDALSLAKLLATRFEEHSSLKALVALMCLHAARFESRIDQHGTLIIFQQQDRKLWNKELIDGGLYYLSESGRGNTVSVYHIEAEIAAQHCTAPDFENTDWKYIYRLYEHLYRIKKNPILLLNMAIVSSRVQGIGHAIARLEELTLAEKKLSNYYLLYATLGEFYRMGGKKQAALLNFKKAVSLTTSANETAFLKNKINAMQVG